MCRCEGYGFQAVYSRIGYINQSVQVQNRVSFFGKLISWLKILSKGKQLLQDRGIQGVHSSIGQQNSAELALVQVKGSRVPAATKKTYSDFSYTLAYLTLKYERNRIFHLCRDMFDFYGQALLSTTKLSTQKTLSTVSVYTKFIYLLPGFIKTGLAKKISSFYIYLMTNHRPQKDFFT